MSAQYVNLALLSLACATPGKLSTVPLPQEYPERASALAENSICSKLEEKEEEEEEKKLDSIQQRKPPRRLD